MKVVEQEIVDILEEDEDDEDDETDSGTPDDESD